MFYAQFDILSLVLQKQNRSHMFANVSHKSQANKCKHQHIYEKA